MLAASSGRLRVSAHPIRGFEGGQRLLGSPDEIRSRSRDLLRNLKQAIVD